MDDVFRFVLKLPLKDTASESSTRVVMAYMTSPTWVFPLAVLDPKDKHFDLVTRLALSDLKLRIIKDLIEGELEIEHG